MNIFFRKKLNNSRKILVIGLTGGIASGKTSTLKEFKRLGAGIVNADEISHELLKNGTKVWGKIVKTFGNTILNQDNEIDRKKLAAIVFNKIEKRKKLENILHPKIVAQIKKRILILKKNPKNKLIVVDIPLLFEAGLRNLVDKTILVWAPVTMQIERLSKRDKMSQKEINLRLKSQWQINDKIKLSDFVIDNSFSKTKLKKEIKKTWRVLTKNKK